MCFSPWCYRYSAISTPLPPHMTTSSGNIIIDSVMYVLTFAVNTSIVIMNKNVFTDPWCSPASTQKLLPFTSVHRTIVSHPRYIGFLVNFSGTYMLLSCSSQHVLPINTVISFLYRYSVRMVYLSHPPSAFQLSVSIQIWHMWSFD